MNKKQIILLSFFSFLLVFGNAQNLRTLKNSGDTYFEKGKFIEALGYYSQFYESQKNDLDVIFKLGVSSFETNRLAQAKNFLNFYMENEKNPSPEANLYLAKTLHAENDFREAANQYKIFLREAKENNPKRVWVKEAIIRCASGLKMQAIDQVAFVENLGEKVNSVGDDFRPIFSPNYEDKIYFSSGRRGSVGGPRDAEGLKDSRFGQYKTDMYASRIINGEWTATAPFNGLLNSARNEMVLDFNEDGLVMYYFKGNNLESGEILVDTFRSEESERSLYSDPFRGPMDGMYGDGAPHFYNDTLLIFASRRAGGYGGSDLYYSVMSNGRWTTPENLGSNINTPFDETSPYLTLNGRTLYYSSNNRKSVGGFDIFKSKFDEVKLEWRQPTNLGLPINSSEDDLDFRMSRDGLKAYFSSNRKSGVGKSDLYAAYFKKNFNEQEIFTDLLTFHDVELYQKMKKRTALMDGAIGSVTGESVEGQPRYNIEDIKVYEVDPLYYESDDQVLTPLNIKGLDQTAEILKKWPELQVELSSNSDETGPAQFDLYFSIKRVEKAADYLKSVGVKPSQIILKGFGSRYPIASNYLNGQPSLIGQRLNRRINIDFHNLENYPVRIKDIKPKVSELLYVDDWDYYKKMRNGLSYKVQIAATKQMYNNTDILTQFPDVMIEKIDDSAVYKYTLGLYKTFASANELKKELERLGVVGAFVVPYINGLRTSYDDSKLLASSYPDLLNFIASRAQND